MLKALYLPLAHILAASADVVLGHDGLSGGVRRDREGHSLPD